MTRIDGVYVPNDPVFDDALFLVNHPSWSPSDLASVDEELLDTLHQIDAAVANAEKRRQKRSSQSHAAQMAAHTRRTR